MVDARGHTLVRDKFVEMLKEYSRLRGWDEETGLPLERTLSHLELEDLLLDYKGHS